MNLSINPESYTHNIRDWLDRSDHYLRNASPGAFFAVTVRPVREGLFEGGGTGRDEAARRLRPGAPRRARVAAGRHHG